MRPSFLDELAWAMAQVYGAVTDRLLINIARHFPYIHLGGEPLDLFRYYAQKLAEIGQLNDESVKIIAESLGGADKTLRRSLEEAITDALRDVEPTLKKAALAGMLPGGSAVAPLVAANQLTAFRTYYTQAADKLNLVNTVMLESTEAAYKKTLTDIVTRIQRTQEIVNAAAGEVVTGASAWNAAMHDAVKKMVDNGLTGFVDHAGRQWSPESYVAMDVHTTLFNTARAATFERAEAYGTDIYQVSSHNGARPLCYPWQGRLISRIDAARDVPDLDGNMIHVHAQSEIESFNYGGGLFGVNCGHYPIPFVPGFSSMRSQGQSPEENEKTYAESQEQRRLERALRTEKRDLEVMRAQGADEEAIKAQKARVKKASSDIKTFCEETGRTRRREREYTPIDAKFPDKSTYDPAEFPTEAKRRTEEYFKGGG